MEQLIISNSDISVSEVLLKKPSTSDFLLISLKEIILHLYL